LEAEGGSLQRALRLRRRLIGTLFHDLSNPLALLQLAVELNEGALVDREERARLQHMVERMQALLDSALDFVAMEGALPPGRLQAVALGPLLAELKALLQPRLDAAGQELRVYCAPQLEVLASPVALRESVIGNLLKLAQARCGAGAKLTLSASSQWDGALIKLEDPGRPLSEQDLGSTGPLLLVDDGPGLGLALVHEHLLRMGGRLELSNLDGGGSLATVRLPLGSSA
jgi:signal transduction histidine kinase